MAIFETLRNISLRNSYKSTSATDNRELKVAAVVNWFGVTDMQKAVEFWNTEEYTRQIVGNSTNRAEFFQLVSPVNYVNQNSPPIISIHGDEDVNVPIEHSTILHSLLDKYQVKNKLIQIPGKKHGDFTPQEMGMVFKAIWSFLDMVK